MCTLETILVLYSKLYKHNTWEMDLTVNKNFEIKALMIRWDCNCQAQAELQLQLAWVWALFSAFLTNPPDQESLEKTSRVLYLSQASSSSHSWLSKQTQIMGTVKNFNKYSQFLANVNKCWKFLNNANKGKQILSNVNKLTILLQRSTSTQFKLTLSLALLSSSLLLTFINFC